LSKEERGKRPNCSEKRRSVALPKHREKSLERRKKEMTGKNGRALPGESFAQGPLSKKHQKIGEWD